MPVNASDNSIESLKKQLLVWHRRWRRLRLLGFLRFRLPPVLLMAAAGLAILDLILALPQTVRLWLFTLALAAILILVVHQIRIILRFSLRDTAFWLDRLSGVKRRPTLTFFELLNPSHSATGTSSDGKSRRARSYQNKPCPEPCPESCPEPKSIQLRTPVEPLTAFHLRRLASRVESSLAGLSGASAKGTVFPIPAKHWLLLPLFVMLLVVLLPGGRTSLARIGAPWLDIPPWSNYQFQIHPSPVRVVYGDGVEIKVAISGNSPDKDVYLKTRSEGGSRKTICFQEENSAFSQRLENVTAPLSFCFSTGRARSRWQPVELLMRPRILEAVVTLQPPAYSNLEARTFELGKKPVRGLPGTRLTVNLRTNRPLRGGTFRVVPLEIESWRNPDGNKDPAPFFPEKDPGGGFQPLKRIEGDRASFSWIMTDHADVHIQVVGIDGLAGTAPVNLRQTLVPDNPPVTEITELPAFALATPESIVKVGVQAEDDLGLAQVDLVRTVSGFRDRALGMALEPERMTHAAAVEFDLAQLGVVPGEVLEFFAEGRDTNPDLTGIASSQPSRLQIISREDYAEILRKRTTMKEFFSRFQVAAETVQNLQKTLNDMRTGLETGQWTTEQLDDARKTAAEQAARAAELFERLGKDFPIYELERPFGEELLSYAGDLKVAAHFLRKIKPGHENFAKTLSFVIDEKVGAGAQAIQAAAGRARLAAQVGMAMRQAARFNGMVKEQLWLTRMILRATGGRLPDLPLLANQAAPQRQLAETLQQWMETLTALADEMPDELAELKKGIRAFVGELERANLVPLMKACADAAEAGRSTEARQKAEEILALLMQLQRQCLADGNCMAQLTGGAIGFKLPADIAGTCRQMLDSLKEGTGRGSGTGGGGGPGNPNDGYSVADEGARNVPMYGPERTRFKNAAEAPGTASATGRGGPGGKGSSEETSPPRSEVMGEGVQETGKGADMQPVRRVHSRYREAIRRYYER